MHSYDLILFLIIIPIVFTSFKAFKDQNIFGKLLFNAYRIKHFKEWYRFFSHGLVHADMMHLGFNMYVLWMFGDIVMIFFTNYFGMMANLVFLGLFIPALFLSSLGSYFKHKDNPHYNAVGASGAVSAIVFASIILYPEGRMGLLFIPFMIPSWLFGLLYLGFTAYMDKKQMDNIGHNAHFWGSVYGVVYIIALRPERLVHFFQVIFGGA
ncbi:MAG: rhomboid family intramembrane serine protease [Bacteroidetes bacterium]|nr:MAG: rhomboid family intramembrane serine protease [Bacteroidota bacterium]